MKKKHEIFNFILTDEENCIFKMYELITKELLEKNYTLTEDKKFEILLEYLRTNNEENLLTIWTKNSLQKEIFFMLIELYKECYSEKNFKQEYIKKFFLKNKKKYFLSSLVSNYSSELKRLFDTHMYLNEKEIFFQSKYFEFYYLKTKKDSINEIFNTGDVFFHIILDGIVEINNKYILTSGDVYFSKNFPLKEHFHPLTSNYSKIIFVIKASFFKYFDIEILEEKKSKFYLPIVKFIEKLLLKQHKTSLSNYTLMQIATYLIEYHNNNYINIYEVPYLNYKKMIIELINENIFLERKVIVDIILKNLDISLSKLYNIFDYLFDMSINKYIDKIKIDKACYLLHTTNDTITTIGMKLNFTETTFATKFFNQIGCSPRKFRKQLGDK